MEMTREELVQKGWKSIGFDGDIEYFAREEEYGDVLIIPVHNGVTIGNVRSESKALINLLYNFISE